VPAASIWLQHPHFNCHQLPGDKVKQRLRVTIGKECCEMVKSSSEREQFSQRLQKMLRQTHHSPDSPTELAREFNIRFSGPPVTVHAARKWLVGEAIPTQDKIRALAQWLVVPADWLRFGNDAARPDVPSVSSSANAASPVDLKLIADLKLLDEPHRQIVREVVRILIRATREDKADH
jgi:transcriptional regulator with XRE-family HTH domain